LLLRELAQLVEPAAVPDDACRDSDDLVVLGTAVAAGAEYLVTGDNDLLDLGEFQGVGIVTPRQFHDLAH
jgi:putative PIN family toxin of toxin-antitoxin system